MVASSAAEPVGAEPSVEAARPEPDAPARPLSAMQVLSRLDLRGGERGAFEIAKAVAEAGGRSLVASAGGRMVWRLAGAGAEAVEVPLASGNPFVMLANARRLERIIRERQVDVVHARSRTAGWSAWLAARRTGRAFVTTWHGAYPEPKPLGRLYNSVLARGRPVIAISDYAARLVRERHGTPPERIEVIRRGIDLDAFSEGAVSAERVIAAAKALGLVEDPRPVVMLAPGPGPLRGVEVFVEVAARIRASRGRADVLFLALGALPQDEAGERLLRLAGAAGALDVVRIAKAPDDVPAAYKLAAVVVSVPPEPEAFARAATEALAMGRPVVALDHGAAAESVEDGATGWLAPPGDVDAVARRVEAAIALGADARARMGRAARARVVDRFSLQEMRRRTLALYARVASRSFTVATPGSD